MANFVEISLPGLNYIAGPKYFPPYVISGFHESHDKYTVESWVAYMKKQALAEQYENSVDVVTAYSAISSGTPKERAWFGYVYRGGHAKPDDFVAEDGVKDAHAYNVEH